MKIAATKSPKRKKQMAKSHSIDITPGISFGMALAAAISFTTHKSILWAMLHGFFSWFYVIYFACTR